MKKLLVILLSILILATSFAGSFNVFALNEDIDMDMSDDVLVPMLTDIYVSADGSDANVGTEDAPVATLTKATTLIASGGTIHIVGTVTIPAGMGWASGREDIEPVTITGGTLDSESTGATFIMIGFNTIFDNITLKVATDTNIYAKGFDVTFNSSVTMPNTARLYGGAASSTVANTNLTVLGGSFTQIYGGGNSGTVTNDVNLYVGGNVNASCNTSSHDATYTIHGGGYNNAIGGDVNFVFTDNAKANYIYGGGHGTDSTIAGNINTTVSGGDTMSVYGGFRTGTHSGNVNLTITGGTIAQVFGAGGGNHTGNVNILVDGGTITRRIYGGCYNEWSFGWSSAYYVTGKIDLTITERANITFSASDSDKSIYAHSRQATLKSTEDTSIIFANQAAYNKYYSKLKAQDSAMQSIMSGVSAADNIHLHGITADDTADTITEGCTLKEGTEVDPCVSNVATLSIDPNISLIYTGVEITPAIVTVEGTLALGEPTLTYSNNVNPGAATATMTYDNISVSKTFVIEKQTQNAPENLTAVAETVNGLADGKINGLTTSMEYSTDNIAFTPVTDTAMKLAAGTYYVRYAETATQNASDSIVITIESGKKLVAGDTNNDTNVNLKDLITLARYVAGWQNTDAYVPALDINGDKAITLTDVTTLARYLAGWNETISQEPYLGE